MMKFQDCEVKLSSVPILAETVTLSTTNALTPIYSVGYRHPLTLSPNGNLVNTMTISYYPETYRELNLEKIDMLKTGVFNHQNVSPDTHSVVGIQGEFYLQSYSIRSSPNEPVRATASYIGYDLLSGNIIQNKGVGSLFDQSNGSGIMHGYSTIVSQNSASSPPIHEFEYNFKAEWVPIYSFNNIFPVNVQLSSMVENFTFVRDIYSGIVFSGEWAITHLDLATTKSTVKLTGLSYVQSIDGEDNPMAGYGYEIDLSGFAISNELVATVNDIVKCKTVVQKFY